MTDQARSPDIRINTPNFGLQNQRTHWRFNSWLFVVVALLFTPRAWTAPVFIPAITDGMIASTPIMPTRFIPPSWASSSEDKTFLSRTTHADWIHIYRDHAAFVVEVSNPLYGPVDVQLTDVSADSLKSLTPFPMTAHLAAREYRPIAKIYPSPQQLHRGIDVALNVVPGPAVSNIPSLTQVAYRLPFRNAPIHITQGFNGQASHHDRLNRFALDFALPLGTPIIASRDGIVMEVYFGIVRARHLADGAGNFIRILHADGAMSLYAHLEPQAQAVSPGDRVKQGQLIGYSGETGFSTGPHLHFAVLINDHSELRSIPFRLMTSLGEMKFALPRAN